MTSAPNIDSEMWGYPREPRVPMGLRLPHLVQGDHRPGQVHPQFQQPSPVHSSNQRGRLSLLNGYGSSAPYNAGIPSVNSLHDPSAVLPSRLSGIEEAREQAHVVTARHSSAIADAAPHTRALTATITRSQHTAAAEQRLGELAAELQATRAQLKGALVTVSQLSEELTRCQEIIMRERGALDNRCRTWAQIEVLRAASQQKQRLWEIGLGNTTAITGGTSCERHVMNSAPIRPPNDSSNVASASSDSRNFAKRARAEEAAVPKQSFAQLHVPPPRQAAPAVPERCGRPSPRTPSKAGAEKYGGEFLRPIERINENAMGSDRGVGVVPALPPLNTTTTAVTTFNQNDISTGTAMMFDTSNSGINRTMSPEPKQPGQGATVPRIFVCSGLTYDERVEVQRIISQLGQLAELLQAPGDVPPPQRCTHVIIQQGLPTNFKSLCALVQGKWVANMKYMRESFARGYWLDEDEFQCLRCTVPPLQGTRFFVQAEPMQGAPQESAADVQRKLEDLVISGGGVLVKEKSNAVFIATGDDLLNYCVKFEEDEAKGSAAPR